MDLGNTCKRFNQFVSMVLCLSAQHQIVGSSSSLKNKTVGFEEGASKAIIPTAAGDGVTVPTETLPGPGVQARPSCLFQ